ncbi:hypothetical protein E2C01_064671 [Portunus trituberculatus]|uniref:Uncharacterized protein n=1 Tax=Portunus trituberculatus TaxID=210409 RepID=A0A5B7HGR5_PORTR|nr:hypothetical protein [Portunus trituberculatus]
MDLSSQISTRRKTHENMMDYSGGLSSRGHHQPSASPLLATLPPSIPPPFLPFLSISLLSPLYISLTYYFLLVSFLSLFIVFV